MHLSSVHGFPRHLKDNVTYLSQTKRHAVAIFLLLHEPQLVLIPVARLLSLLVVNVLSLQRSLVVILACIDTTFAGHGIGSLYTMS